jgi:hypothetical protein
MVELVIDVVGVIGRKVDTPSVALAVSLLPVSPTQNNAIVES